MLSLNPIAKAVMAAVVALLSTFVATASAGATLPVVVAGALIAAIGAFGTSWAHETPAVKAALAGVVAALTAVAADYGHVSTLQLVVTAIVQLVAGAGLVASVRNKPALTR